MSASDTYAAVEPGSILKELIDTPFLQEILRDTIMEINPKNGTMLVRTLLWDNIGMILSLLDAVPPIANYLISAVSELLVQVDEKFSPTILLTLAQCVAEDVDATPLQDGKAAGAKIVKGLMEVTGADVPAAIGKGITALARSVNTLNARDPNYIPSLTARIMSNIDNRELSQMTNTILNSVLNQRPPLISWARNLFAGRIKERYQAWRKRGCGQ